MTPDEARERAQEILGELPSSAYDEMDRLRHTERIVTLIATDLHEQPVRCRQATQRIIDTIGSVGPENLESALDRLFVALRAQRPQWTKEKPTEPGWYWARITYRKRRTVRVIEVKRREEESRRHGLYIYAARSIERCTKYEWAPVLMPEEGHADDRNKSEPTHRRNGRSGGSTDV